MIENIKRQYSILKNFFVIEGIDGAGTTTQLNKVNELLLQKKIKTHTTFEPTKGKIGLFLRECIEKHDNLSERTFALLFAADRQEHIYGTGGILEHIKSGNIVICDRYLFSSLAYQGDNKTLDFVYMINSEFPLPEAVFFIDIDEKTALNRIKNREKKDIFEKEETLRSVRENYHNILNYYQKNNLTHVKYFDGNDKPEDIACKIFNFILKKIDINKDE